MNSIRQPAVAGTFYPEDKAVLYRSIQVLLDKAEQQSNRVKALIVPHAGYIYSGVTAACGYKQLLSVRNKIKKVLLLGPSHRFGFRGLALPQTKVFNTPLGEIEIDSKECNALRVLDCVVTSDQAHETEHSLEVQLPFLQYVLDEFTLVPLVVGDSDPEDIANIVKHFWQQEETLVVVSTDLSHFHSYKEANKIDSATTAKILSFHTHFDGHQACGCVPLNGLLLAARQHNFSILQLDQCNSGDTAGDKNRVVGYGSYVLY